jgi:hypothetical protein
MAHNLLSSALVQHDRLLKLHHPSTSTMWLGSEAYLEYGRVLRVVVLSLADPAWLMCETSGSSPPTLGVLG